MDCAAMYVLSLRSGNQTVSDFLQNLAQVVGANASAFTPIGIAPIFVFVIPSA